MYLLPMLFFLIILGCEDRSIPVCTSQSFVLRPQEYANLVEQANKGDKDAAWRIYNHYSMGLQNDAAQEEIWLRKSAKLSHHEAQRWMAYMIKENNWKPGEFGKSASVAVRSLLQASADFNSSACYELAECYETGYFGIMDLKAARMYYEKAAKLGNTMAWKRVSEYFFKGMGGGKDISGAYFWISLDALCVDPRSVGGKEIESRRQEIEKELSLAELENIWPKIDSFIQQVRRGAVKIDTPPFHEGMVAKNVSDEGRRIADSNEQTRRARLRHSNRMISKP